jgi:hypothetical protein
MRAVEHVEGHYDVQEVEFGRVYWWCPECVVVECKCAKRTTFKRSTLAADSVITCECGEDRANGLQEEEVLTHQMLEDEDIHPWRYWRPPEGEGPPF